MIMVNMINGMEISDELKSDIELNQTQLKTAICNHQNTLVKLELDLSNIDLQNEVKKLEEEIVSIGLEQKTIVARLRNEYKIFQKTLKINTVKNGLEERRSNLTNALNRARKQAIVVRSGSATSHSEDSNDHVSPNSSPEHHASPVEPHEMSQQEFLHNHFSLCTHEQCREMQNRRVERKRRSTANPQFLYGNKGWDFLTHNKRRRNNLPASPASPPPPTRPTSKKRQEAPPAKSPPAAPRPDSEASCSYTTTAANQPVLDAFPIIPNLPSGLIIERVGSSGGLSPDSKTCITCKQPGVLSICEVCSNGFHISCHNRPLTHTPRQCPKCMTKETRTVGALNVPSGMSVSYVTPPAEMTEKLNKKMELEDRRQNLVAELTQLQNQHSQLNISLRDQQNHQDQLLIVKQKTEDKIQQIITFIDNIKKPSNFHIFDNIDSVEDSTS